MTVPASQVQVLSNVDIEDSREILSHLIRASRMSRFSREATKAKHEAWTVVLGLRFRGIIKSSSVAVLNLLVHSLCDC